MAENKKFKFTTTSVKKIPYGPRREYWDSEVTGFGVRVNPKSKQYQVFKRVKNKVSRVTIGDTNVMTAEHARNRAREIIQKLYEGIDVNAEMRERAKKTITLKQAIEAFFKARTNLTALSVKTYKTSLKHLTGWDNKELRHITPEMVSDKHLKIARECGKIAANKTFISFRIIYNFAKNRDAGLPENPVKRLTQERQWFKTSRRTSIINDSVLPVWMDAISQLDNPYHANYLKLLLFTGLRKNEALTLKWENVELEDGFFTVTETKNKYPHKLPITGPIQDIFEALLDIRENEYVFPAMRGVGHMSNPITSINRVRQTGIHFTLHDLRRTFATTAENTISSYAGIKRLLNHVSRDVTGGYINIPFPQVKRYMEAVTAAIEQKTQPPPKNNVIQLGRKTTG